MKLPSKGAGASGEAAEAGPQTRGLAGRSRTHSHPCQLSPDLSGTPRLLPSGLGRLAHRVAWPTGAFGRGWGSWCPCTSRAVQPR